MDPQMFVQMIIRPPRSDYQDTLNGKSMELDGKNFKYESFEVANPKGEKLQCSMFEPATDEDRSANEMPCIIYMHGNASNKMEGLQYAPLLASHGLNLVSFDFSGCGKSEGDWVTLGHKEVHDLQAVIEYIYENKRVSSIGLWGRSMGATTALLY